MYRRSSFRYRYRREEPHNPVPQPGDARRCTPAGGSRAVRTNRCAYGIPKRLQEPIPEDPARGCRSPEAAVPGVPLETGIFWRYLRALSAGCFDRKDPGNDLDEKVRDILNNCKKKTLPKRVQECPPHGIAAEQDYNAAANIRRVGIERPFEPVEMAPHITSP